MKSEINGTCEQCKREVLELIRFSETQPFLCEYCCRVEGICQRCGDYIPNPSDEEIYNEDEMAKHNKINEYNSDYAPTYCFDCYDIIHMLFTVGHKKNYLDAIKNSENGIILKIGKNKDYEGGCVFLTREEADNYLVKEGEKEWCVWGLKTTIDNTVENDKGYRNLLNDCEIINLEFI